MWQTLDFEMSVSLLACRTNFLTLRYVELWSTSIPTDFFRKFHLLQTYLIILSDGKSCGGIYLKLTVELSLHFSCFQNKISFTQVCICLGSVCEVMDSRFVWEHGDPCSNYNRLHYVQLRADSLGIGMNLSKGPSRSRTILNSKPEKGRLGSLWYKILPSQASLIDCAQVFPHTNYMCW